ncbi:hypothetical protein [Klebsiella pneumoniae]|uniref:hypothetical protein n=1 Tax=Klebsiella pneumoniae TaxID=573 RepID=UPI000F52169C|nr:hypothetical protein [Klebsiella pneumoniae]
MEAKGAIELWKDSNKELLNVAFSKLDESQRNTINNFRQLTESIGHDTDKNLIIYKNVRSGTPNS